MHNKHIKSILQDALEEQIPASQINLLPVIRSHLVAGKTLQQGEQMKEPHQTIGAFRIDEYHHAHAGVDHPSGRHLHKTFCNSSSADGMCCLCMDQIVPTEARKYSDCKTPFRWSAWQKRKR
jgi:hypothetical protein